MSLKMQTQEKEKTQERSKSLQSQRKYLNVAFGEKLGSRQNKKNSNHAKIKKIGEKVDFEMARILSLVLLFGFIYPCTLLKSIKKILIVCLIVSHSHLFLIGGSCDNIQGN